MNLRANFILNWVGKKVHLLTAKVGWYDDAVTESSLVSQLYVWCAVCSSCLVVSDCFMTPWTVACQAPLSIEFSRQEYWIGLPFPAPGDHPNPAFQPLSPASLAFQVDFYCLSHQGSPGNRGGSWQRWWNQSWKRAQVIGDEDRQKIFLQRAEHTQ